MILLGALTETVNSKYAEITLKKRDGEYGCKYKTTNRFIEQCLGQPQFADRCESLIEFKERLLNITKVNQVWKNQ